MGRNWAIAIGINNYSNLRHLKYAKADAEAMKNWFEKEAKFDEVFLFTEDSPSIPAKPSSIPTMPTYGHLRRFLRAQFEKPLLKSGDNLWFFFAGHGRRDRERDYLMLSDSDPGDIENTAISVDYVTQRLRKSGADNVILFLDACRDQSRSGGGIQGEYKGVVTFYSCSPDQRAYEIDQYKHGSFTYALLEGLRIQGEGNCATVERLEQHLRHRVPQITNEYWKEAQNPYASAEPATKLHLILLPDYATLTDIDKLKIDAYEAEAERDWELAEQLWIRVNVAARGSDLKAIEAFPRIDRLRRRKLRNLQQSLQLNDEDVLQIKQTILTQKETERVQRQRARSHASYFTEDLGNSINLEMIAIPGGTFMMGSPEGEGDKDEKPQHEVTVQAFYMGKYPITQAQYQQIMGNNPSKFKGDERPVEQVSWNDAVEFCQRLSKQTGKEYRLPTEAEWEYACRAGTKTPFYFGSKLTTKLARCQANIGGSILSLLPVGDKTTSVGQFTPNAFGLYDMHGNVWEWCQDKWHDNYKGAPTDGSAWLSGKSSTKVRRGGSWSYNPWYCRSAYRVRVVPVYSDSNLGFRVACGGART